MVIKTNLEQRYATSAVSAFFFRACGAKADLPFQEYAVPAVRRLLAPLGELRRWAAWPCGQDHARAVRPSGRFYPRYTGIRCVDVRHGRCTPCARRRARTTCSTLSEHFKTVFEHFPGVDSELTVDGAVQRGQLLVRRRRQPRRLQAGALALLRGGNFRRRSVDGISYLQYMRHMQTTSQYTLRTYHCILATTVATYNHLSPWSPISPHAIHTPPMQNVCWLVCLRATETAPWETLQDGTATMPRPAPPQRRRLRLAVPLRGTQSSTCGCCRCSMAGVVQLESSAVVARSWAGPCGGASGGAWTSASGLGGGPQAAVAPRRRATDAAPGRGAGRRGGARWYAPISPTALSLV